MNTLSRKDGFIKPVLIIVILALLVYGGIEYGMPYYRYSMFKSDAEQLARVSLGRVDKLRETLMERAGELKIPLSSDNLYVERGPNNTMRVSAMWYEDVDVLGVYQKTLQFNIDITE